LNFGEGSPPHIVCFAKKIGENFMTLPYVDCKKLFNEEFKLLPDLNPVISNGVKVLVNPILNRYDTSSLDVRWAVMPNGMIFPASIINRPRTHIGPPTTHQRWAKALAVAAEVFGTPQMKQVSLAANNIVRDLGQEESKMYKSVTACVDSYVNVLGTISRCADVYVTHLLEINSETPKLIPYHTDQKPNVAADLQVIESVFGKIVARAWSPEWAQAVLAAFRSPTKPIQSIGQVPALERLGIKGSQILEVAAQVFQANETMQKQQQLTKKMYSDLAKPESMLRQCVAWGCEKYIASRVEAQASYHAMTNTVKEVAKE
jgi:hypothetical protein